MAAFGEILRGGKHTGQFGYDDVLRIASAARGDDPYGYRSEFLQLVRAAKTASAIMLRTNVSRPGRLVEVMSDKKSFSGLIS